MRSIGQLIVRLSKANKDARPLRKKISPRGSQPCQEARLSSCIDAASETSRLEAQEQLILSSLRYASTMAATVGDKFLEGATGRNTRGLLRVIILCFIAAAAVSSRLFSVIRFESIIHEC